MYFVLTIAVAHCSSAVLVEVVMVYYNMNCTTYIHVQ